MNASALTAGRRPTVFPPEAVKLSAYPHPYVAAMAICSDLDRTPDAGVYYEIARFLNTQSTTAMGPGAGLEVGNSLYFDMRPGEFAYWNTDDAGREMALTLIKSGHIDVLHSYGDLASTRADAQRAIDELAARDCRLQVWVDHSKAPTNFGPDIMVGSGDVPESPAYHADLTLQYGIRYVWRGRTTGINGQNVPVTIGSLRSMLDLAHPIASSRAMLKERVKIHLGRRRHPRWEMYAENRVRRMSTLRDGQKIWEFLRSNTFYGGSGWGDTADGIAAVLTPRMLSTLEHRQGVCILYTHLGKVRDPACPFQPPSQAAFRRLAEREQAGRIFVTTTHRLLRYLTIRDCLEWTAESDGGDVVIRIGQVRDPVIGAYTPVDEDLQGLTFETPRCDRARIVREDGRELQANLTTRSTGCSVTLPWRRLQFPEGCLRGRS